MTTANLYIDPKRVKGVRNPKIFGHFLEHFHRQIYGGIYDPDSPRADAKGFRADVLDALKKIRTPIIRWPGGCFVSAYHWKDGVGRERRATFDKAWRVEEPNTFGTDEFIQLCTALGTEPYICANAGTGSPEEISDWVEYCNLKYEGSWAKLRIQNGHPDPYRVKYWSIGNENYGSWEIGAKSAAEWGRFVGETAKMMKRVDPSVELLAASVADLDWNFGLLKEAGPLLDWISIHGYWDPVWHDNKLSTYEKCMAYTLKIEEPILKTKYILGALGYLGKIRIAFDEWNLRGWYHPKIHRDIVVDATECIKPRDDNDLNDSYTMADAVFSACFLNQCLKHCDIVGMANFAPSVNTRGMIYTHREGIVLRSTYFVFELYTRYLHDTVIDSYLLDNESFEVSADGSAVAVPALDVLATRDAIGANLSIAVVNRHPDKPAQCKIHLDNPAVLKTVRLYQLSAPAKDSYNDIDQPDTVRIHESPLALNPANPLFEAPPHSVSILVLNAD